MGELRAYRESLKPHRHRFVPLSRYVEWCPTCGAVREADPSTTELAIPQVDL